MLTPTEQAASQIKSRDKCSTCKTSSNITYNGLIECKKGFSPRTCTCYQEKPEISLERARGFFK